MTARKGEISQRIKGRGKPWQYRVDVAPEGAPRDQRRKGGFCSERACQEALTELLHNLDRGSYVVTDKITFGAYLEGWLAGLASRRRATTVDSHGRAIRLYVLCHPIAHIPLQKLGLSTSTRCTPSCSPSAGSAAKVHSRTRRCASSTPSSTAR